MKGPLYVLTGGPGFRKTTIINELSKMGYYIVPEAATIVIDEAKSKGIGKPWEDLLWFQTKIVEKQLQNQSKIPDDTEVFMDRSVLDNMGFSNAECKKMLQYAVDNANKIKFDRVFLIEPVKERDWNKDGSSHNTYETALRVHKELEVVYRNYGYNPIKVPELVLEERLRFILDRI